MSVSLKNLSATVDSISTVLNTFTGANIALNEIIPMVATGAFHSVFVVLYDNTAMTCGDNTYGQLGIGSYNPINKPSYVKKDINTNLTNVKSVHAGTYHTIFLLNDGTVYACGDNTYGQLGLGNNTRQNYATLITGLTNVKSISCGAYHTIFILNDGNDTVKACGKNTNGQLGDGTTINKNTPVNVIKSEGGNLTNVKQVSSNKIHTMFLLNDGKVMGCGNNDKGQIGDGTILERLNPVYVKDSTGNIFTDVKKIATGTYHTIFLKKNGTAYGCGIYFIEFIANSTTPVSFVENVTNIYSGDLSIIYLVNNETYYKNGYNLSGLLGSIQNINGLIDGPQEVVLPTKTIYISIGKRHSLFYINDTAIIASGCNINGQLGIGTNTNYEILQNVIPNITPAIYKNTLTEPNPVSIFAVYSCGYNHYGESGQGINSEPYPLTEPTLLRSLNISRKIITHVACSNYHSLFLDSNGRAYSSGQNADGRTGQNTTNGNTLEPTQITVNIFDKNISQIACGEKHSIFVDSNGRVYSCGKNTNGQLGQNHTTDLLVPTLITATSISDKIIRQVDCSYGNVAISLFVDSTGRVYSCGSNQAGHTGQPYSDNANFLEPTIINSTNISNKFITQVSAGIGHSLFLDSTGKVYSCGLNPWGESGQGTTTSNPIPTQISTNISDKIITQISAGSDFSLFLDSNGRVYSCGQNSFGKTGQGVSSGYYNVPTLIGSANISNKIITKVSTGHVHSLFLDSTGRVYSCGYNLYAHTGQNTTVGNTLVPTLIESTNISDKFITQISCGEFNSLFLGIKHRPKYTPSRVYSSGRNTSGQTGLNTYHTVDTLVPTLITNNIYNKIITQISTGSLFSMFLDLDGRVYSCGQSSFGALGQPNVNIGDVFTANSANIFKLSVPTLIGTLNDKFIIQVSAGAEHALFLDKNGRAYSCGYNYYGQCGQNSSLNAIEVPTLIASTNISTRTIIQVAAGAPHSLFLDSEGKIYSCGENREGKTGFNTTVGNILVPTLIDDTSISSIFFTQIACGFYHSLFLDNNGIVYSCGRNVEGQLGQSDGFTRRIPTPISISSIFFTQISGWYVHSLFLDKDGRVYSCGLNEFGRTGQGTAIGRTILPTLITSLSNSNIKITNISTSFHNSFFIDSNGTAYTCSRTTYVPIPISSLSNTKISQITGGDWHSMFLEYI